jgi:hypothetical protein
VHKTDDAQPDGGRSEREVAVDPGQPAPTFVDGSGLHNASFIPFRSRGAGGSCPPRNVLKFWAAADDFADVLLDRLGVERGEGICQGGDGISCAAGSTPLRISLWTEPMQIPSRVAVASALIVSARGSAGLKASIPSRSRSSRTRTVVQALPSSGLHRIRFSVTASSRSGNWPPSFRTASTGLGWRSAG